jgi:hypothetical protein
VIQSAAKLCSALLLANPNTLQPWWQSHHRISLHRQNPLSTRIVILTSGQT